MTVKSLFLVFVLMFVSFNIQSKEHNGLQQYGHTQVVDPIKEEQERLAVTINMLYKHTRYEEVLHVVETVYSLADKHSVKPTLVLGIIATESGFNRKAKSPHGAVGYTQVAPKWHHDKIKGRNLFNTQVNIEVGILVFVNCLNKHKQSVNRALACYNGAVHPKKQQTYIAKVTSKQKQITTLL